MGSRRSNPFVKPGQKNPIDSNTIRSSSLRDYTPSDRPFHERADAIELERVQAEPVFDQAVGRDAWLVLIVVQSEGTGHLCETNTERQVECKPAKCWQCQY